MQRVGVGIDNRAVRLFQAEKPVQGLCGLRVFDGACCFADHISHLPRSSTQSRRCNVAFGKNMACKRIVCKTRVIFEKTKILYHYDNTTYTETQTFFTDETIGKVSRKNLLKKQYRVLH